MKLLLDENLPRKLKRDLPNHEVFTVREMGWAFNRRLIEKYAGTRRMHAFDPSYMPKSGKHTPGWVAFDRAVPAKQNGV